jgi:hypothetical protein
MNVNIVMLFSGTVIEYEVHSMMHHLFITIVARVEKLRFLHIDHTQNHWPLTKFDGDSTSKNFLRNIRQYNCLFAFMSMGANIDNSVNDGRGPPLFKIYGQVHHRIGSLLPPDGSPPKFIQLYIYDTANEVQNRLKCLNENNQPDDNLDQEIVKNLIKMLDDHNPFAKKFRMARDRLPDHESEEFTIRIIGAKEGDPVQYSLPTTDELAMLIFGNFSLDTFKRDIIIETQSKELK